MQTRILQINPQNPEYHMISEAAEMIRRGGLVIFPTETVYGIAVDATNPEAIKRLQDVKRRSENKPFSLLIYHESQIRHFSTFDEPVLYKLMERYWPGPMTMVLPSTVNGRTIALRMPDHQVAVRMLKEANLPIVAPSANFEGEKAPVTCSEAISQLDGRVDLALDAGAVTLGKSSTIIDLTQPEPVILREGAVPAQEMLHVAKQKHVLFVCTGNSCRSVMAEYMFKHLMADRSDVFISSTGTGALFVSGASAETVTVLQEKGIDAAHHQSTPMTPAILKRADLILVMTQSHRAQVINVAPEVSHRVYLLKEFASFQQGMVGMDIPDPIGHPVPVYRQCLDVITEALMKVKKLV